jgi:hypothetical protein
MGAILSMLAAISSIVTLPPRVIQFAALIRNARLALSARPFRIVGDPLIHGEHHGIS